MLLRKSPCLSVVTGACGFIGLHLTRALLEDGRSVVGVDDLTCPVATWKDEHAVFEKTGRFAFEQLDMSARGEFSRFVGLNLSQRINSIFNLACPASPKHYKCRQVKTLQTSFIGALECFETSVTQKCVVVHASTSEVYGDPAVSPQKESYWGNVNPWGPRSCYDEGKRAAEALARSFNIEHEDADIRVVRIFNTCGEGMDLDDGRIVVEFAKNAINCMPILIHGDGEQTRCLCHVSDTVNAIIKIANFADKLYIPMNIGNTEEMSVNEIALRVKSLFPESTSEIIHVAKEIDDPRRRVPDISFAETVLKWKPLVRATVTIEKTVEYVKKQIQLGKK